MYAPSSCGILNDEGYDSTNGDEKWKVIAGSLIVAHGNKHFFLCWTMTSTCVDMANMVESIALQYYV